MAIEKVGNKVYASINDLPILDTIRSGDSFIVQTTTGTNLLGFNSLLLTLDNVSFKNEFNEMWETYSASSESINKIGTAPINIANLNVDDNDLCSGVNQLNINDITNYNELASAINNIINLINLNADSFPNKSTDVNLPLDLLPTKS